MSVATAFRHGKKQEICFWDMLQRCRFHKKILMRIMHPFGLQVIKSVLTDFFTALLIEGGFFFFSDIFYREVFNLKIVKNKYNIFSDRIPQEFDGFTITQISDLHSRKVDSCFYSQIDGDIVVLTGDIMDASRQNSDCVVDFVSTIAKTNAVYYVTGNHEAANLAMFENICKMLATNDNVHFLSNESFSLFKGGQKINLIGLNDLKYESEMSNRDKNLPDDRLAAFNMDSYSMVLLHSPNNIETIAQYQPDLVLCGHTHGGQWRIPKLGSVYAPGQGFFPKYDRGQYRVGNTDLIISSGVGFSRVPIRIFCPAEINNIILHSTNNRKPY